MMYNHNRPMLSMIVTYFQENITVQIGQIAPICFLIIYFLRQDCMHTRLALIYLVGVGNSSMHHHA